MKLYIPDKKRFINILTVIWNSIARNSHQSPDVILDFSCFSNELAPNALSYCHLDHLIFVMVVYLFCCKVMVLTVKSFWAGKESIYFYFLFFISYVFDCKQAPI